MRVLKKMSEMKLNESSKVILNEALSRKGLRSTKQREHIFAVLLNQRDHPTADEVCARSRESMTGISLATVYNCLETLVGCGLVRQVNYDRDSTRYCPNLAQHAHFHDRVSGRVLDISLPDGFVEELKKVLPDCYVAETIELSFRGTRANESDESADSKIVIPAQK